MICKIFVRLFFTFTIALHKNVTDTYAVASGELSQICLMLFLYLCGETLLDC